MTPFALILTLLGAFAIDGDPACEMVRQGHATDWPRYSGGHYRGCQP